MAENEKDKSVSLQTGFSLISENKDLEGKNIEYRIQEVLGQGGFGITYKATDGNSYYAIKECFRKGFYRDSDCSTVRCATNMREDYEAALKDFEKEAKRLIALRRKNKNIVQVVEFIKANKTAYYIMEFLNGPSLAKYTKKQPVDEKRAIEILKPIFDAVDFLHNGENKFMHLDIKPENIVITQDSITHEIYPVLIDFGTCKTFDSKGELHTTSKDIPGVSPGYSPIEQYGGISRFDARLDVYSLGATMFYLLTGKSPINAFDITNDWISNQLPASVSDGVRKAVIHAMQKDKSNRTPDVKTFFKELTSTNTNTVIFEDYSRKPLEKDYILAGKDKDYFIEKRLRKDDIAFYYSAQIIPKNYDGTTISTKRCIVAEFYTSKMLRTQDRVSFDRDKNKLLATYPPYKKDIITFNNNAFSTDKLLETFDANNTKYYAFEDIIPPPIPIKKYILIGLGVLLVCVALFFILRPSNEPLVINPEIITQDAQNITTNSAFLSFQIENKDNTPISEKGIFVKSKDTTIQYKCDSILSVKDLKDSTEYLFSPYLVTEKNDTVFGEEKSFITKHKVVIPTPQQKPEPVANTVTNNDDQIKAQANSTIESYLTRYRNASNDEDKVYYLLQAKSVQSRTRTRIPSYQHSTLNSTIATYKRSLKERADKISSETYKNKLMDKYYKL